MHLTRILSTEGEREKKRGNLSGRTFVGPGPVSSYKQCKHLQVGNIWQKPPLAVNDGRNHSVEEIPVRRPVLAERIVQSSPDRHTDMAPLLIIDVFLKCKGCRSIEQILDRADITS